MIQLGSQMREKLSETDYSVWGFTYYKEAVLRDGAKFELWAPNDHYSGYVIEINGVGYEFVTSLNPKSLPACYE